MKKQPKLSSLIDKACFDYNLIEKGDRILIGASGGKDSTALIEYFANRAKRPECGFEYKALFIKSDFAPEFPEGIMAKFREWNVPFESINVNVLERVKPGQKMSCWWCSTQRRSELLSYALDNDYNKIALGHHMDDILETLLMNMLNKGELAAMPPRLKYDKFPVSVVRPLCYVSEERLIEHAKEEGYAGFTCTCNYQDNSDRKEARRKLEELTEGSQSKKERLFASLRNIQPLYLP
ncbi:tRNA 2-thiocytidine biosynthesis TtcA family protein [Treponema bryantii]|uniref:tRNA 2-thiocytidine biosynthesis TtcA family protein n=1 Tax=Treponema bryantii TaxID=163 RepID=UPI0030C87ABF